MKQKRQGHYSRKLIRLQKLLKQGKLPEEQRLVFEKDAFQKIATRTDIILPYLAGFNPESSQA